ncbi:MAG: 2-oxoacid:acceptor oxidoreductase subunit alpha [Dehalococcoidales bacterium]|nr:2-oxoacid:acceptor oxidoreductase subunit alpha [Dehalococcoidales bacterium]
MSKTARLMQGNEALVGGALAAGVRFFAGYPITPATEITELMARMLPRYGGKFIQMEDEMGSMGAVIGASVAGAKAMTASSGPGISLKQENIGFAVMAEIPCVVVNVMRGGPSTGLATLPAQMDVMQARWGVHGDHPTIALAPWSVAECFQVAVKAVNLAERFRTPVYILSDAEIAHMREVFTPPSAVPIVDRPRPTGPREDYVPYRPDERGIPAMADFGTGYRWHPDSNVHDEYGFPAATNHVVADRLVRRLVAKVHDHADEITEVAEEQTADAEIVVFAFGSVARSASEAVDMARERGIKAGLLRPISIWPFPDEAVARAATKAKAILVAEANLGQLVGEVKRVNEGRAKVAHFSRIDGLIPRPQEILAMIKELA